MGSPWIPFIYFSLNGLLTWDLQNSKYAAEADNIVIYLIMAEK